MAEFSDYRMKDFPCYVDARGVLPPYVSDRAKNLIKELAGKKIYITIDEYSVKSSNEQRRYYFGVIVRDCVKYFAVEEKKVFTKEQMHDSMMRYIGGFSNPYVSPFSGEPDAGRVSYNDLTTAQAEGYHTLCLKWAAGKGFQIALPNEKLIYDE